MSIRFRIIVGMLLLGAIGFIGITKWMFGELRPYYLQSMEETMVDESVTMASLLSTTLGDSGEINCDILTSAYNSAVDRQFNAVIYNLHKQAINTRLYVTDRNGITLFNSSGVIGEDYSQWHDVFETLKGNYGARTTRDSIDDPNSTVLYVASPIMDGDSIVGSLTIGKPAKSMNSFIAVAKRELFVMILYTTLILTILVTLFTHWVTNPVRKLTGIARTVAANPARTKITPADFGIGKQNEILQLATALEEMRESLAGQKYVEQYVESLTHEIKSPLTAIRGAVELIDESMPEEQRTKFLGNIHNEAERIATIIDRLLQLSNLEHRHSLENATEIELEAIIGKAITALAPQAEAKQITVETVSADNLYLTGEPFLLEQALINIIGNAIDFTPQKETIFVAVALDDSDITITITDRGEGIPEYALEKVFDRFYSLPRPSSGRKSSGLGLPFVKEVMELHRGDITITSDSNGTVVTMKLPVSLELTSVE